jgi:hypothetical protein
MKFIILLSISASFLLAKSPADFNAELLKNVQKEIQKDDEKFRTQRPERRPASVEPIEHAIEEPPKIDKVRQIGPSNW